MADQLTKLLVEMEVRAEKFEKGMNKAQKQLARTQKRTAGLNKSMGTLGKTLIATFSAGVIVRAVRNLGDMASEMVHAADTIGINVESMQAYQAAGEDFGISANNVSLALRRFNRRLGEAASTGKGELAPVLERLGISIRNTDGSLRDSEAVLEDYADAIAATGSRSEQLALAFKAFDSEGAPFVQLLGDGSAGLRDLRDEMIETGRVLDEDYARALERATTATGALIDRVVVAAQTQLGAAAEAILFFWDAIGQTGGAEALSDTAAGLKDFATGIETSGRETAEAEKKFRKMRDEFDKMRATFRNTPEDKFFQKMSRLNTFLEEGVIVWSEYQAAMRGLEVQFDEASKGAEKTARAVREVSSEIDNAAVRVRTGFADELAAALVTGEANFRRFAQAVISDLARILTRQLLVNALTRGLGAIGGAIGPNPFFGSGASSTSGIYVPSAAGATSGGSISAAPAASGVFAPSVVVNMNAPQADPDAAGKAIGGEVRRQLKAAWLIEARNQQRPGGALNPVTGGPV